MRRLRAPGHRVAFSGPPRCMLRATALFDNSANNPANPDPRQEVRFGEQMWDEVMLGYFDWVRTGVGVSSASSGPASSNH